MFRKKVVVQVQPEWLVVGLGNPGPEYRGTRHNLGFEVIDLLAEKLKVKIDRSKHRARYALATVDGVGIALVKPLTFMNLSGQSVAPFAKEFGLKPERVLIVADDTDLAPGRIRLKPQGSAGGHNGHKSIIASLGTTEYPRLKVGIGRVGKEETVSHVLGGFTPDERAEVDLALRRSVDVIVELASRGLASALNLANSP